MDEDAHFLAPLDQRFDRDRLTDRASSVGQDLNRPLLREAGWLPPSIGPFDGPVRRSYLDQPVGAPTALGRLVSEAHRKRLHIERVTARWHLSFRSARSKQVNDQKFPDVVQLYRQHFEQHEFPSQPDEFLRSLTTAVLRKRPDLPREDVRARATMFLAGLVRQHHFALLLQEHFDLVIWDDKLDREHGVDLVLIHEGKVFGLALSVSGYKSQVWQERKRYRHPPLETLPICQIDAPIGNFRDGKLWLHGDDDLRKVHEFVRSSMHVRRPRARSVRNGAG
jgi:hypothetical protein